ncbi:MAG TPA: MFS transporter [Oscillospiraceae bacterium]|nr:MFS transporter [Oscillospiraceae bacterium]
MGKMKTLAQTATRKVSGAVKDVKTHWNEPKEGEYVSYKEFLYFILGAGGCQGAGEAEHHLSFTAGCFLVGAIYKLAMKDFVLLGLLNTILSYLFNPINMLITDNLGHVPKKTMRIINYVNLIFFLLGTACFFVPQSYFEFIMPAFPQVLGTRLLIQVVYSYFRISVFKKFAAKYGKYKPWIFVNYIPFVLTSILLVYFPYGNFLYHQRFWIMHLMFSIWGLFANYNDQVGFIENVITPNTAERTKILSYGSLLYNLFPSIVGIILPVFVAATGGFTELRSYRGPILILMLLFSPLSLFLAFKVKERVIIDFDRRPEISLKKGVSEVVKNKYVWLTHISNMLGTFRNGSIEVATIMAIYMLRKDWILGIYAAIIGTANIPGYLTANFFTKKFGKKKLVITSNYFSILASVLQIVAVSLNSFLFLVIVVYITRVIIQVGDISKRGISADIWDYQQYLSGERLESFMEIINMFIAPFCAFAGLLVPAVYAKIGFTSDWTVLFDPVIRNKVFIATIIINIISGILSLLPWHFYDLNEQRHKEIIKELSEREKQRLESKMHEEKGSFERV